MAQDMTIESYLAAGGRLSNPTNVPPRYRAELLKLMATFVDSELAGAAGFADIINQGPGLKERIAASRIVLEKTAHAEKVLRIMGEFGVDTARYASHHPWTARLDRGADIGASRTEHDMRLAVFNYPLTGWEDAVMMNLLMGCAVRVQLREFCQVSYQPLADVFRDLESVENRHTELAAEGALRLMPDSSVALQASADYWWPRVSASFGSAGSDRTARLKEMGLRKHSNAELRAQWEAEASAELARLGLRVA